MAIGRRNAVTNSSGSLEISGAVAGAAIRQGAAVGVVPNAGSPEVQEVSAGSNGSSFLGFSLGNYSLGDTVRVLTVRGSTVTPIVENNSLLNSGSRVFLSSTNGEVTETAPMGSNRTIIQVGVSSTTDTILLITDFRVRHT